MSGRSEIAAGRAYVELYVKNSLFYNQLELAKRSVQDLAGTIMKIGSTMTQAGGAILAPIAAAVTYFEKMGSKLNDMAMRTGESAAALFELGYAAEQSGASLADVERAINFMHKNLAAETFDQAAERIGKITNATHRAAEAFRVWGKGSAELLPMLGDLKALREEARALGAPTEREIQLADSLGDALGKVRTIAANTAFSIGSALAPSLLEATEAAAKIAKGAQDFVRENGELIRSVAKVAAGVAATGLAVTALGGSLHMAGSVFGIASAAASALGVVLGALTSPIVLVTAGLAGIGYAAYKAGAGAKHLEKLREVFTQVKAHAIDSFHGIKTALEESWAGMLDAIMAGDFKLAMEVASAGMKLVWLQTTKEIDRMWADSSWYFQTVWSEAVGNIAKMMLDVSAVTEKAWAESIGRLTQGWNAMLMVGWAAEAKIRHSIVDLQEMLGRITEDEAKKRHQAVDLQATGRMIPNAINMLEAETKRKAAHEEIDANAKQSKGTIEADRKIQETARDKEYSTRIATMNAELNAARAALTTARAEATQKAEYAREGVKPPGMPEVGGISQSVRGSFYASSLFAMGGTRTDRQAEMVKILDRIAREAEAEKDELRKLRRDFYEATRMR